MFWAFVSCSVPRSLVCPVLKYVKYVILQAEGEKIDSRKQAVGGSELVKNGKLPLGSLFCGMSLIGHQPSICSL
jgi:hypothetical protein